MHEMKYDFFVKLNQNHGSRLISWPKTWSSPMTQFEIKRMHIMIEKNGTEQREEFFFILA